MMEGATSADRRMDGLSSRHSLRRRSNGILAVRLMVFVLAPLCRSEAFAHSYFFGTRIVRGGSAEMDTRQPQQRQPLTCVMQAPPPITSSLMNNEDNNNNGSNNKKNPPIARPTAVEYVADTRLPTDLGEFRLRAYRVGSAEPCVIYSADHPLPLNSQNQHSVPVRVHDQCMTSEVFRSQRCDCKEQLLMAMKYIKKHGGCIIYLQQEGRGIGFANKIAAYALQDVGLDTVDANLHLGFPEDMREYDTVPEILKNLNIPSIRLLTNNPRKVQELKSLGVAIEGTIPMVVPNSNEHNHKYLMTKRDRMDHVNLGDLTKLNGMMAPRKKEPLANGKTLEAQGVVKQADGYCFGKQTVLDAIDAMKRGEMVLVVDDMDRENEGDFIMAADACTPEKMAEIIRYSSGVICVAMEGDRLETLELPSMVNNNQDPKNTAFAVSVDATKEHGITTGISATDRSRTVQLLANAKSTAKDFSRPGHLFPLKAKAGGVLTRDGHTEATVDLSRLAGRAPVGVLCEIVSEENPVEMMRLPEMKRFAKERGYVLTSIADLIQYRKETGL